MNTRIDSLLRLLLALRCSTADELLELETLLTASVLIHFGQF